MSDFKETGLSIYDAPVSVLLRLGEPRGGELQEWRNYAALGISPDSVPDLIRMATDEALNDGPRKSSVVWAPVHAWRALGQLRASEAVEPLLTLFQRIDDGGDDWVGSDLPKALARIGAAALDPLTGYLSDRANGTWARVAAAEALGYLGVEHPELRAECVARLAKQLDEFAVHPASLNTFVIYALWDLRAVEAMPVIERAFASGRVDESVFGDLEDVQIHFGLKSQREHPPRPNSLTELSRRLAGAHEKLLAAEAEKARLREAIELTEAIAPLPAEPGEPLDDLEYEAPPKPHLAPPKVGRNEPCPCGSGRKFKKCCGA